MKKFISLFLATVTLFALSLSACGGEKGQVGVKYYQEGSMIVQAMLSDEETIGLVPEPAASNLIKKAQATQGKTLYRLDLQELYDADSKAYPQAVMMVKESVLATYGSVIDTMLSEITDNVSWVKANAVSAVTSIKSKFEASTLAAPALSETAIDGCKIYSQRASDAKSHVKNYLNEIIAIDQSSAKAVNDDFFYTGSANGTSAKTTLTVSAPDGAPALAIAKFIADNETFGTELTFNYNVIKSNTIPVVYRGAQADIIIMPVNIASKFYNTDSNASDPYKMVSVITHGNFYIISTEKITVDDLKGKQVAVPNQNAVPDWTFRLTMKKYNLEVYNVEG